MIRHVFDGREDEATMIRNFMYGLEPELGSRLVGSNFSSLSELVEKVVNVETVLRLKGRQYHILVDIPSLAKEKTRISTKIQYLTKAKGEDLETKPTIVVALGYVTHVISRDIFQGFVPKTRAITNEVTSRVIHR